MLKTKPLHIAVATIIGLSLVGVSYYFSIYETPEECFVREINEWGQESDLINDLGTVTRNDSKIAAARAKTILNEYTAEGLSGSSLDTYIQIGTFLEYCGVK